MISLVPKFNVFVNTYSGKLERALNQEILKSNTWAVTFIRFLPKKVNDLLHELLLVITKSLLKLKSEKI
jgi:hypothetical protein